MSFPCSQCGLCCRKAKEIIEDGRAQSLLHDQYKNFPYGFTADGACEKYDPVTRLCTVYDNRPDICKYGKLLESYPGVPEDIFNYFVAQVCNDMMDKNGVEEKYRIDIKKIKIAGESTIFTSC